MRHDGITSHKEAMMTTAVRFDIDDAHSIGTAIGIDWESSPFDAE